MARRWRGYLPGHFNNLAVTSTDHGSLKVVKRRKNPEEEEEENEGILSRVRPKQLLSEEVVRALWWAAIIRALRGREGIGRRLRKVRMSFW